MFKDDRNAEMGILLLDMTLTLQQMQCQNGPAQMNSKSLILLYKNRNGLQGNYIKVRTGYYTSLF